jgi:ubiquitin C-terminal hydrolase
MVSLICELVQIQEGRMEPKELLNVVVCLEGKDIFIGHGSQWKVKGKDIVRMEVENDIECLVETQKNMKFHFVLQQDTSNDQTKQWKSFLSRLRANFERNASQEGFSTFIQKSSKHTLGRHSPARRPSTFQQQKASRSITPTPVGSAPTSSRRPRGVFGNRKHVPAIQSLDEKKLRSFHVNDSAREAESVPKRKQIVPVDPDFSEDDEHGEDDVPLLQDDAPDNIEQEKTDHGPDQKGIEVATHEPIETQPKMQRKTMRVRKMGWKQPEEDDVSDDEDLFSPSNSDLTTPANQRVTLPNVVTNTNSTVRSKNSTTEVEKLEEASERKSQSSILQFFSTQSKAESPQSPLPTTPAKQTHLSRSEQSARYSKAINTTIAASATKAHRFPIEDNSRWLQSSPARTARSPQEKRRKELFGPHPNLQSAIRRKNDDFDVLRNDPIGEFSSPPRKLIKTNLIGTAEQPLRTAIRRRIVPTLVNRFANSSDPISSLSMSEDATDVPEQGNRLITGSASLNNLGIGLSTPLYRKFRGLRNLGNTCYQNASLQLLYTCRNLMSVLQESSSKGPLTSSICAIARALSQRYMPPANSRSVKDAMDSKTDKYVGYEQRDAHEFLSDLVDFIHDELDDGRKTEQDCTLSNRLPTDDFCMRVQVCLKCCSCGYTRNKEEMYRHLSIDIINNTNVSSSDASDEAPQVEPMAKVETSLAHFFQPEIREIKCEKCEDGSHAQQTLRILSPPRLLVLHLKRFIVVEREISPVSSEIDVENHPPNSPSATSTIPPQVEYILRKNKAPVAIPASLSLDSYIKPANSQSSQQNERSQDSDSDDMSTFHEQNALRESNFELQSIVHHIGSRASSGHYTADAVRTEVPKGNNETEMSVSEVTSNDFWVSFDDSITNETSLEKILENRFKQSTAYMLLYSLKQP